MNYRAAIASIVFSLFATATNGQVVTEFPIPTANSGPLDIVTGPDGNLWFTEYKSNKIGRMTPAGVFTEFTASSIANHPVQICAGPDGNLWYSLQLIPAMLGRLTPSGVRNEFPTATAGGQPSGITAGPDGNVWYTAPGSNRIGRMTPAGVSTEFVVPTFGSVPHSITAGPDGNLWFTENGGNKIGRITPAGSITEFTIPTPGAAPRGIVAGSDGALWFTEAGTAIDQVGRITTAGLITEFLNPSFASPSFIAAGPDGNLWVSEPNLLKDQIGRVTPAGAFTDYPTLTADGVSQGITPGPDGAMWFVQEEGNKVGRITIPGAAVKFNTLAPCRVADTRLPDGPWGGPALVSGATRSFVIGGRCGVPATATAVSFNFTITGSTGSGFVKVYPGGAAPPATSTLNWSAGQTRANNALIGLGTAHDVAVGAAQTGGGTVHLIIDVNGYFQ